MARTRTSRGGPGRAGAASVAAGVGAGAALKFMNRRLNVLRGTSVDDLGDASDVGAPLYSGIPDALAEVTETVFDAATQRPQTIRSVKSAVPGWADIISSDTLQDPDTGWYYIVLSIENEPGIGC